MSKSRLLTLSDVADHCGLALSTVSAYRARGYMPDPDQQYGRTPLWRETTIEKWRARQTRAQVK